MISRFGFLVLCGCRAVIATWVAAFIVCWPFTPIVLLSDLQSRGVVVSPLVFWPVVAVSLLGGLAWAGYAVPRWVPGLARWVAWEEPTSVPAGHDAAS
ncbi:MAG: hypothetical protein AAF581_10260 [Planctomycetota bacterium]